MIQKAGTSDLFCELSLSKQMRVALLQILDQMAESPH
jgi:hypothetical protein